LASCKSFLRGEAKLLRSLFEKLFEELFTGAVFVTLAGGRVCLDVKLVLLDGYVIALSAFFGSRALYGDRALGAVSAACFALDDALFWAEVIPLEYDDVLSGLAEGGEEAVVSEPVAPTELFDAA